MGGKYCSFITIRVTLQKAEKMGIWEGAEEQERRRDKIESCITWKQEVQRQERPSATQMRPLQGGHDSVQCLGMWG